MIISAEIRINLQQYTHNFNSLNDAFQDNLFRNASDGSVYLSKPYTEILLTFCLSGALLQEIAEPGLLHFMEDTVCKQRKKRRRRGLSLSHHLYVF